MKEPTMVSITNLSTPPREPTEKMINAIHNSHRPGWDVTWKKVWITMYDAWAKDQVEPLIAPTCNLNGTMKKDLIRDYLRVRELLSPAIQRLRYTYPHGRDYQTVSSDVHVLAMKQHEVRCTKLIEVYNELEQLAIMVDQQSTGR